MKTLIFSLCVFFNASICLAEVNSGDILKAVVALTVPSGSSSANSTKSSTTSTKIKPTTQPALTEADVKKIFPWVFQPYQPVQPKIEKPKQTRQLEYPAIASEKYDITHSNLGRKLRAYWDDALYGTKAPELYSMPERVWYGFWYWISWVPVAIVYVFDLLLLILMFVIFGVILWVIDGLFWSWMAITGLGLLLGTRK